MNLDFIKDYVKILKYIYKKPMLFKKKSYSSANKFKIKNNPKEKLKKILYHCSMRF